jgi:hypothetical protein
MKLTWKSYFQNFFKSCDIFGQYIRLYIRGETQYKSTLGGICTVVLIIIGVYFAIYFSLDMVYKVNPNISVYSTFDNNSIKINNSNFFFAFQISFSNHSIHDISKYVLVRLTLSNRTVKNSYYYNSTNIPIIKCEKSFVESFNNHDKLNEDILKTYNCPDLKNVTIYGDPFYSLEQSTIWIDVSLNHTAIIESFKDVKLLYINGIFPLRFKMYYQSYSFNPEDFKNPFTKNVAYSEGILTYENLMYLYMGFSKGTLIKDDSYLMKDREESSLIGFKSFNYFSYVNQFTTSIRNIFNLNIYLSAYEEIYKRSYMKLQDVGAQSVGIIRILMTLLDLFLFLYTFNRINEQLAFKFFKYEHENTESAKDLFRRRKTIIEKELKIHFPKRQIKDFASLLNSEGNHTQNNFTKTGDEKENLQTKQREENKKFSTEIEFGVQTEKRGINLRSMDGSSDDEHRYQQIFPGFNTGNDLTFNKIESRNVRNMKKKKKMMKIIETSLKQVVDNGSKIVQTNKVATDGINKIFNLEEIMKKSDKMSFRDSIKLLFFCCPISDKLKEKKKFYVKAEEKIKEKLDIVSILSKLEEFDNMKILFLNSHQNLCLKYCKKANILNTNLTNLIDYNEIFQENGKKQNIITLIHYFVNLIRSKKAESIDKKLLEMVQPEILTAIIDLIE